MLCVNIEKRLSQYTLHADFTSDHRSLALFGASGAGKSMTLKCIAGIEKPDKGVIILNDKVLFDSQKHINLPPQKRRVGYLFQDYALFPNMTVRQNITTGLKCLSRKEQRMKCSEYIERFHLNGLEDKRPDALSGGEKQRVALARIFASAPDVLLLDEPFSSLDTLLKLELYPYIKRIIENFHGESILVTHSIDEVLHLSENVVPISDGHTQKVVETKRFYTDLQQQYQKAGIILPEYEI